MEVYLFELHLHYLIFLPLVSMHHKVIKRVQHPSLFLLLYRDDSWESLAIEKGVCVCVWGGGAEHFSHFYFVNFRFPELDCQKFCLLYKYF